jgi:diaminobutyrate-2-oxoglutarate transaminase
MTVGPPIEELHLAQTPEVDDIPGETSRRLIERQSRLDSSAIAYPDRVPMALSEAKGATIEDADGNVFLDLFGGIGVANVGHSNPYVVKAVTEQTERLVHTLDFPTDARLELLEELDAIAPGDLPGNARMVFGGPTGTDAIEATIKLAKDNTDGRGLVAFRGGYHGTSTGAMSLSSARKYKEDYAPLLADVTFAPYPDPVGLDTGSEITVEHALSEVRAAVEDPYGGLSNPAGIWVEPIQGEGGVAVPPEGFLRGLGEIAAENDLPLIVDEIQTGIGRTGEWFASDHFGVTPDAVTMAKALGGIGLPLSGTLYHEDLDEWEPGSHVGTFRGYAPAFRAGVRAIEYIRRRDLLAHATELGAYIRARLREAGEDSPFLVDVRGKGLLVGAEFRTPEGEPFGAFVDDLQRRCFERGVLVWTAGRDRHVLRLLPPLVLTERQAEAAMDVVTACIEDVMRERG